MRKIHVAPRWWADMSLGDREAIRTIQENTRRMLPGRSSPYDAVIDVDMTEPLVEEVDGSVSIYDDGVGNVALLDVMGDQYTPAEDARTSTGKGRLGHDKDMALTRRLMDDNHTSPFEGVLLKFEMTVPIFVLRELDRHRTVDKNSEEELITPEENLRKWFARNEMSARYVQLPPTYYHPSVVRTQAKANKQGLADAPSVSPEVADEFKRRGLAVTTSARELYDWAVENGIERGQARIFNTFNQYTTIRITGSLKNFLDVIFLRLQKNVLWECRRVADAMFFLLETRLPDMMSLWVDRVYDARRLSAFDAALVASVLRRLSPYATMTDEERARIEEIITQLKVEPR